LTGTAALCEHVRMTTVAVTDAARDFTGTLRRVTHNHEAVVLRRGSRTVAVIMPPDMAEDLADIRAADAALAEHEKHPASAVSWESVKRETGLA
jgi:antitoxin (DNA-binding transcriptional repressor) of toxin-antitoxin stability system